MWNWLTQNHGAVTALTSCLTLVVWLLYFQLLYTNYRRSVRPKILITLGGGPHVDAECIITNMSTEPIYLDSLVLSLHDGHGDIVCSLSDLTKDETRHDLRGMTMQGSLASGEMISLGSYRHLLRRAGHDPEGQGSETFEFSITAIAIYTAEDNLVAAERRFTRDGTRLRAHAMSASQIRSRRDRARLEGLVRSASHHDGPRADGSSGTSHGSESWNG